MMDKQELLMHVGVDIAREHSEDESIIVVSSTMSESQLRIIREGAGGTRVVVCDFNPAGQVMIASGRRLGKTVMLQVLRDAALPEPCQHINTPARNKSDRKRDRKNRWR